MLIKINQYQTNYILANLLSIYYHRSILNNLGTSLLMAGRSIFVIFMLRDFLVWTHEIKDKVEMGVCIMKHRKL